MFKPIEPLAQAPCENTEKGVITEVLLRIRVETPVHTIQPSSRRFLEMDSMKGAASC